MPTCEYFLCQNRRKTNLFYSVNAHLHDFVLTEAKGVIPAAPALAISPFEAGLLKAGWEKNDSDEE